MKKRILVIGLITATLCLIGCQKKDPLPIPEYPLNEQIIQEISKKCEFPEEWTIVENEMRQSEGIITSSYSLKAVNTEVYAGMKVGILSHKKDENRVVTVSVSSLDNAEELSKEECEQALIFTTHLFGGFYDESAICDVFLPVFETEKAFEWEQEIETITCKIEYDPQNNAGKLHISMSDNKELLYPQWPDLGIELSVKDVSATGLTLVVTHKGEGDYCESKMGPFQLETFVDGKWKDVPVLENVGYVDNRMQSIPRNASTEFEETWEMVYGSLGAGKYRMNRFFHELGENLNEENGYQAAPYSVEFEISDANNQEDENLVPKDSTAYVTKPALDGYYESCITRTKKGVISMEMIDDELHITGTFAYDETDADKASDQYYKEYYFADKADVVEYIFLLSADTQFVGSGGAAQEDTKYARQNFEESYCTRQDLGLGLGLCITVENGVVTKIVTAS